MRLWSIHPKFLDTKGLVAVWREGLLALHVLNGRTKGYINHPQLLRFKNHPSPVEAVSAYLHAIADEADARKYLFKREKLGPLAVVTAIPVAIGQLQYEVQHLKEKLKMRDAQRYASLQKKALLEAHPLFTIVPGDIEVWEKRK